MNTYDIFLVPEEKQYIKFNTLIKKFNTKFKTPSFPHITVIEKVEMHEDELLETVELAVKKLDKLNVEILGINVSNTINQCVFAQVKMSEQLLNFYNELCSSLNTNNFIPFFPHLSFIYGDISTAIKFNVAKSISVSNSLSLDKVVVFQDGPLITNWRKIAEYILC